MRVSQCLFATLRDFPADAEVMSHKLMAKAGMILKVGSGVYDYSPIFLRTLRKVMRIVSEEMDRAGAQEMLMPILQPQELWERSGRLDGYLQSGILWRARDRKGAWFALGPTHEEVVTDFVGRSINSYKQLPVTLYQQQDKFRDEIRPRFGLMRSREFMMKDAYSFDADAAGLDESYRKMREAYLRVFRRCGLDFMAVQADPGAIGGTGSEEFMVTAETGEDELLVCQAPDCGYAANVEKAASRFDPPCQAEPLPMRKESTPDVKTVDALREFFPELDASRMVKTILYNAAMPGREDFETVAVLIRADQDINEIKLANALGAIAVDLADDEAVKAVTGAAVGFAGPVGLVDDAGAYRIRVLADETARGMTNFLCGCNETDFHALDVNFGRDVPEPEFHDLRKARVGEPCPVCGAPLATCRGVEVGHVFKLGVKYSEKMGATFLDEDGKERPFVMGCYGIGSSRVAAAAVEQRHDDKGIRWPVTIAPYHVHIVAINAKKADILEVSEKAYRALLDAGIETLFDDRPDVRGGAKFADADLVGIPWRVTVGRGAKDGKVEVVERATGETVEMPVTEAVEFLRPRCLTPDNPTIAFVDPDA